MIVFMLNDTRPAQQPLLEHDRGHYEEGTIDDNIDGELFGLRSFHSVVDTLWKRDILHVFYYHDKKSTRRIEAWDGNPSGKIYMMRVKNPRRWRIKDGWSWFRPWKTDYMNQQFVRPQDLHLLIELESEFSNWYAPAIVHRSGTPKPAPCLIPYTFVHRSAWRVDTLIYEVRQETPTGKVLANDTLVHGFEPATPISTRFELAEDFRAKIFVRFRVRIAGQPGWIEHRYWFFHRELGLN